MEQSSSDELRPLGALAPPSGSESWPTTPLARLVGRMPEELRTRVATYLGQGTCVLSWMGYSQDAIGEAFVVPGGNAILSDGVYYWRLDAAEYVRVYGLAVPPDALAHMETANWEPRRFSRPEQVSLYERLSTLLHPDGDFSS